MELARRLQGVEEYYFSKKLREVEEMNKQGKNVLNLGIGSPDLPPHPEVIKELNERSQESNLHGYQSYKGLPALRNAMSQWYKKWYNVEVNPNSEILPLMGSKEGIMHICMTYLDEGDVALVPDPGYPTYASNIKLTGAKTQTYNLNEGNNWSPDFEEIEKQDLSKVKLFFVNYTQMPTGKPASVELFEKIVAFAKKHAILVVHDNPYSFILNNQPLSILSVKGAKDVVIELNSLSKSHNMAGWRIGMMLGNAQRIEQVLRFKSNMDSGMFAPLQYAAIKALSLEQDWHNHVNNIYRARRQKVYHLLDLLKCVYDKQQIGLFIWAKIPDNYKDCYEIADDVLYQSNVFITPGGIFGSQGNRYIRISLCGNEQRFDEAISRIKKSKLN